MCHPAVLAPWNRFVEYRPQKVVLVIGAQVNRLSAWHWKAFQ